MQPATAQLTIHGLSHSYRKGQQLVLHGISINVAAGEIICLAGPSGCGKSTLLRLVAGLETVQQGNITLAGKTVSSPEQHTPAEKRNIGLVFQDFALFPHMNLLENVAFGLHKLPRAQRQTRAMEMLKSVGLDTRAHDFPHLLSGGQQQRVALARALAARPQLVLLDEPFSNLDVRLRHRMRTETMQLLKSNQTASIMVTHDPEEAMYMADRIVLINQGEIIQIGTPEELYYHPLSPFAAEFFGDINLIHGIVHNQCIETPLGLIKAVNLPDNTHVNIVIRPEAIELTTSSSDPNSIEVEIQAAHMLGAYTLLELHTVNAAPQPCLHIQAQTPSHLKFDTGQRVYARLRKAQGVFCFPVPQS
jgi:ABC-type spermidine/putrescine transport systems, ATPase components